MEEKNNSAFIKAENACKGQNCEGGWAKEIERAKRIADKRTKRQRKRQKKEKGKSKKGLITAVIALSVCSITLLAVLTVFLITPSKDSKALESVYQKSFYDIIEQVDNIDLNMSKALASKDTGAIQGYLTQVSINSELCENDIQTLPLQDEYRFYTAKLVNQIGDYSKHLNKKIIDGQGLSSQDEQTFRSLYEHNKQLKQSLYQMQEKMRGDFSFKEVASLKRGSVVLKGFEQLQNLSVEYPELIYDGPFSDGLDNREVKGVSGSKITCAEAVDIFKQIFSDYSLENIKLTGEVNSIIPAYAVSGEKDGEVLYAQITKTGGHLLDFSYAGSCKSVEFSQDYAINKATEFMQGLGLTNFKPVWINLANNVYTINFAYSQDGVIVYADLVKVRVCAEQGKVIGIESSSYLINHTNRDIESAKLTEAQAQERLLTDINVENIALCLVPVGNSSEKLCYEICGDYDNEQYYIYIDAISGKQVQMFKVISSNQGKSLL